MATKLLVLVIIAFITGIALGLFLQNKKLARSNSNCLVRINACEKSGSCGIHEIKIC